MEETLQNLILELCLQFPYRDVNITNIFDQRRFVKVVHYAWKYEIGFHPYLFKTALEATELFGSLPENEIEQASRELCIKADFVKSMFHSAFDLENLSI